MSIIPLIFIIIRRVHFEEKGINLFISAANKASALLIFLWSSFSTPPTLHALDTLRKHLKLTNKNVFSSLFGAVPENWKNEICHQAKNWISSRVSIRVCWPYSTLPPPKSPIQKKMGIDSYPPFRRSADYIWGRWRAAREDDVCRGNIRECFVYLRAWQICESWQEIPQGRSDKIIEI